MRIPAGWLLAAADAGVLATAFWLARVVHWLTHEESLSEALMGWRIETGDHRIVLYGALGLACLMSFRMLGHYDRRRSTWQEWGDVVGVVVTMALIDAALVFVAKLNISRLWMVSTWFLVLAFIPLGRMAVKGALASIGVWQRSTLIIGTGANAQDAALAFSTDPLLGYAVKGFVAPPGSDKPTAPLALLGRKLPVFSIGEDPSHWPAPSRRAHLVVALELDEFARHRQWIDRLLLRSSDVDIVSPLRGLPVASSAVSHFFSHDVLTIKLRNNLASWSAQAIKRGFDILGSCLLLIGLSPLFAWIAWRIRRTGPGIFFGHQRVGRNGVPFRCYKFRTMVRDAEERLAALLEHDQAARAEWEEKQKLRDDPRITAFGAFLRRTSLDELPQLWNVLKGEMSLVGPRPVMRDELARYGEDKGHYLSCRPGITGLWQVSGRTDVDYRRRVHLDCWYVRNWRLWYDVIILIKTLPVPFVRAGAY